MEELSGTIQRGIIQRGIFQRGIIQRGIIQRGIIHHGIIQPAREAGDSMKPRVMRGFASGTLGSILPLDHQPAKRAAERPNK